MHVDTRSPAVTRISFLPVAAPAFSLLVAALGAWVVATGAGEDVPAAARALVLAAFAASGLAAFLAVARREDYAFDRHRRVLSWSHRGPLGARGGVLAFEAIRSVQVLRDPDPLDEGYRLVLELAGGDRFPLDAGPTPTRRGPETAAAAIRAALASEPAPTRHAA